MILKFLNDSIIMKRQLKTVLIIFLRTCKTVSRKPYINIEINSRISKFSYKFIVVKRKIKLLAVVTPPDIYDG